jgi:hypothetical protein
MSHLIIDLVASNRERQVVLGRASLVPIFGQHVQVYDAEALPCRCPAVGSYLGIAAAPVEAEKRGVSRRYRCLTCGTTWRLALDGWSPYDVQHAKESNS